MATAKRMVWLLALGTAVFATACSDGASGSGDSGGDTKVSSGDPAGAGGHASGSGSGANGAGGDASSSSGGPGGAPNVTPGGPVLFFSDLASGPRSGNSDDSLGQTANQDGAIVTVWGKNLGETQGTSTVSVGGLEARVYSWGPATQGANLHVRMGLQAIALQIPGGAPLGAAPITVTVGGVPSNDLSFTARDQGKIYFVTADGSDAGNGSWTQPWATFDKVTNRIENGDVVYFGDGFRDHSGQSDTGFFGLNSNGTAALPKAIVAYPGATATVGGDRCEPTGHALINNYAGDLDAYTRHWVISKFRIHSPPDCDQDTAVEVGHGYRLVGNYISTPRTGDGCQSGAVQCGGFNACGDDLFILGNELADAQTVNASTGSKQCHGFYISGNRQDDGVERNREIAWNYIHDCANNRAINIYNESYNGEGAPRTQIEGHHIHDNWVENQRGIGLLLGQDVTGDNWFYNNIFVNTGLGPEFPDGGGFFPLELAAGSSYDPKPTTLYVFNNLVYGASYPGGPDWAIGLVYFEQNANQVTLELQNNIFVSTEAGIDYVHSDSSNFDSSNNLWFGAGPAPGNDASSKNADPLFVAPGSFDFHLQAGSPAKTGGVPTSVVFLDFDGIPRPEGSVSIGPYQ
jgi:hypothetical protein